jgi:hypothetical protein
MSDNEGRRPYQFWVDKAVKEQALHMLGPSGTDLSAFMRMAMEQFVERPVAESLALLTKHNTRHTRRRGRK